MSQASELFSPASKLINFGVLFEVPSDLRIVETLDKFLSSMQGHGLSMSS